MGRTGFTLVELLVVVAILAAMGGIVLFSAFDAERAALGDLTLVEMEHLRRAILAFRRDTGFLPRQGPFRLTTEGGAVPVPPEGRAWFHSPANLGQLYENPLQGTGHPLERYDPIRRRGWRGPYLARGAEGKVRLGDGVDASGTGDPASGALLPPMPALAAPGALPPDGPYFQWTTWEGTPLARQGRPYLLFDLDDPARARIVALGADGTYGTSDDRILFILR